MKLQNCSESDLNQLTDTYSFISQLSNDEAVLGQVQQQLHVQLHEQRLEAAPRALDTNNNIVIIICLVCDLAACYEKKGPFGGDGSWYETESS